MLNIWLISIMSWVEKQIFFHLGKMNLVITVEGYKMFVESTRLEQNSIILLATINDEIISIASINSSQKDRMKHVER